MHGISMRCEWTDSVAVHVRRSDVHVAANLFTSGASGSPQMRIHDAIEHRRVIKFHYKGLPRIAAPHVLGIEDIVAK